MNRYGRGGSRLGGAGSSKANPNTVCQKCLKKGHYSFECKEPRTERPYVSRPSRTQQLLNPKLVPKLMSDETNNLLRKKGIADEELARKEAERAKNGDSDMEFESVNDQGTTTKRQRSTSVASSKSTHSISSYSTDNSRSRSPAYRQNRSPDRTSRKFNREPMSVPHVESEHKRRRAASSSDEEEGRYGNNSDSERRTRRRFSDASPEARGRRRSLGPVSERIARQVSRSPARGSSQRFRRDDEPAAPAQQNHRQENDGPTSHSNSRAARVVRDEQGRRLSNDDERYGASYRNHEDHRRSASPESRPRKLASTYRRTATPPPPPPPQPARERSLSPFSKRVALTRDLNEGK